MDLENVQEIIKSVSIDEIQTELATRSLYEYTRQAWHVIEPGRPFKDNWHIGAISEHLQAVLEGEILNLIINIPPRHMKSILSSVALPTYAWIDEPSLQFLFASYGGSLAMRDSVKCRRLIQSNWYQERWGDRFHLLGDQNQKQRYENSHNGHRIATSVGGALIGEGGDVIVVDDPHNTMEVESDITRQSVLDWWDQAVQSRLNDPKTGRKIVIMQRLHHKDLVGHILEDAEDWNHLCIPAEYDPDHPHPSKTILDFKDPRSAPDELLWPGHFGRPELEKLKKRLGSHASAGQLQQRPSPKGGGILKESWWREWPLEEKPLPLCDFIIHSWDTAYSAKKTAAYSVRTSWGVFQYGSRYHTMLISYWRKRVEYPELRKEAKRAFEDERPDAVLIEKKASGQSLIQDLRMAGIPVIEYTPDRDKVARAHASSPLLESGLVWYVDRAWSREVLKHCSQFPAGDGADVVDTCTQAWIRFRNMWFLKHPEDVDDEPEEKSAKEPVYG